MTSLTPQVCQKLIEVADPSQRGQFSKTLKGHILSLLLVDHGRRVVGKLLVRAAEADQRAVLDEILPDFLTLATGGYAVPVRLRWPGSADCRRF